jgi:general stress protein 26
MLYKIGFFIFFWTSLVSAEYDLESSKLRKINDYFHKCPLAVISTIDESQNSSASALIAFAQNDDLELYFMTFVDSRKYVNLQNNQSVSLVIGFDYTTVQYEGIACALRETAIKEALYAFSLKETPCSSDFLDDPRARFFKIVPKWIRYSDYTICPAEIFEQSW